MATPLPPNRAAFTVGEIAAATGGRTVGVDGATAIRGVSTDSRAVGLGALFVALLGETHDAHDFVAAARERGALPMVRTDRGIEGPRVEVDDTLAALGRLARAHVERVAAARPAPALAIGGAAGKTTTKTLAAAAVAALCGDTLVTAGNLNNRIGVPLTLLSLEPRHRAMVVECGTSVPGEIAELGRIVRPDVAVVLNVGVEHSERLGDLVAIAEEEAALLAAARRVAITAREEPLLVARLATAAAERRTFGLAPDSDLRLLAREPLASGRSRLRLELGPAFTAAAPVQLELETALLGADAALDVAAALAGALALVGRPATAAELAATAAALAAVEAVPGRLRPLALGGALVLDDTYNSNPKSLAASLAAARELAARRGARLLVALGDMLELGPLAEPEHDTALAAVAAAGAAETLLVGPLFAAAAARRNARARCFEDGATAASGLELGQGDVLLVKGSRGMRMERLIDALEGAT